MSGVDRWDRLVQALGPGATRRAPLGARTTYRVGGPAAVAVTAESVGDLCRLARVLGEVDRLGTGEEIEVLVVGRGSNLLVADEGFDGVVVFLGPAFEEVTVARSTSPGTRLVTAGGGTALPVLARRTAAMGLRGLEWAVGVPGSVGGAVCMNAGGHGSDVAASLVEAQVVDLSSAEEPGPHGLTPARLQLGYRQSALSTRQVVTAATFEVEVGDRASAEAEIADVVRWRVAHQPGGPNAGSVFKNPEGHSAGALIESAGLRGHRLGSAQVSPKHANFICTEDGGRARHVADLIELVAGEVQRRSGVVLSPEVRMVGFGDRRSHQEV